MLRSLCVRSSSTTSCYAATLFGVARTALGSCDNWRVGEHVTPTLQSSRCSNSSAKNISRVSLPRARSSGFSPADLSHGSQKLSALVCFFQRTLGDLRDSSHRTKQHRSHYKLGQGPPHAHAPGFASCPGDTHRPTRCRPLARDKHTAGFATTTRRRGTQGRRHRRHPDA